MFRTVSMPRRTRPNAANPWPTGTSKFPFRNYLPTRQS
jgi:hypothetical protein